MSLTVSYSLAIGVFYSAQSQVFAATSTTDDTAAATTTTAAKVVSRTLGRATSRLQSRGVRRLGTQHPESADVQGHACRYARPGQHRSGRGQGDQRRGGVDQAFRPVRRGPLRRIVRDGLVTGS